MNSPILITGIPRSGTSMIAAAINACGVFGGTMSRRGMFTNDRVREQIVKPYLARIGADAEGQWYFPVNRSIPMDWSTRVEKIMIEEGYKEGPWMYKDSRSGLIWPVWHNTYPDAKWVIVRRRTGDILNSCIMTGYMLAGKNMDIRKQMGASSEKEAWLIMVHEYEKQYNQLIEEKANYKVIWPERMVQGDFTQMYEICEWLGITWSDKAFEYINPLLWGKRKERRIE